MCFFMTVCNNSSHTLVSAFDAFQDKKKHVYEGQVLCSVLMNKTCLWNEQGN